MGKDNDWKSRLQVVYSTNPDYNYVTDEEPEAETLPKQQQKLRVQMEKNHRGGKTVTIVDPHVSTLIGDATAVSADILGKVTGDITGKVVGTIKVTDRILNKNSGDSAVESNNHLYKATLTRGDEMFVQFVGGVNENSVKQAMTLTDSTGTEIAGSLVGSCGGSRWTFVPDAALSAGTYTLTVKGNTVRALDNYDTVMVDGSSYTFTVE